MILPLANFGIGLVSVFAMAVYAVAAFGGFAIISGVLGFRLLTIFLASMFAVFSWFARVWIFVWVGAFDPSGYEFDAEFTLQDARNLHAMAQDAGLFWLASAAAVTAVTAYSSWSLLKEAGWFGDEGDDSGDASPSDGSSEMIAG